MQMKSMRHSDGVALLAALFVLMVLSILAIGLLMNVDDDLQMSKSVENSEMALKVAEAGIQIARSTFFDPAVKQVKETEELASIDGFYMGGYFLAQLRSGFQGEEKWTQWRYDADATGHNSESEVSAPVFHVWRTGALGVNGSWASADWRRFSIRPIYGIVARGTYFPIQLASGGTDIRAHDEYSGETKVDRDDASFSSQYYWTYDKTIPTTFDGLTVNYGVEMSPMVSYSNYVDKVGAAQPVLSQQTLYFVYSGSANNPPDGTGTTTDRSSTVRLRAINALCNGGANTNHTADEAPAKSLWEFDTRRHGIGTAPTIFDPTPGTPGDEILYFAVIERGKTGSSAAFDLKDTATAWGFPFRATQDPEQIYLYAVVDTTGNPGNCTSTGSFRLKWNRPFPDPDVMERTDYPTEHLSGTNGQKPPYAYRPADMTTSLPEGDLLVDYRDGPSSDGQWNQVRGDVFGGTEISVGPPVVKVLYRDSATGALSETRPTTNDQYNPVIDIYLMYAAMTRVTYQVDASGQPLYGNTIGGYYGTSWGPEGYRQPNTSQVRVLALRDRLVRSGSTWNWTASRSRYPTFKWNSPVPGWDPDQTFASPDDRPNNGYGPYNWNTYFSGQIVPMVNTTAWDENMRPWATIKTSAGGQNRYNVVYPYYKSVGFCNGSAYDNAANTQPGPATTAGSPVDFSGVSWADAHIMMMAFRDTWDDYRLGNRTNIRGSNNANPALSNPIEPYWTHANNNADPNTGLLTYNSTLSAQYAANTTTLGKTGFPRPYAWWEELWTANVRNSTILDNNLYGQGWENVITTTVDESMDADIEGETAAMCSGCLQQQGMIVLPFNHDLNSDGNLAVADSDREDLRLHAINATTGLHAWAYHMPTSLRGDDANNTPAIANNLVFVAYQQFGDKTVQNNRKTLMTILDADDGTAKQKAFVVDRYSDAIILPPTIANGAVYVGTYSFEGTYGSSNTGDDWIKLFAMSPVIRLVSTGVYPFDVPGRRSPFPLGYRHYTGMNFRNITMLDHDTIFKNPTGSVREVWKRKLQVWVTGQNSKWEEVREVLEE